MLYLFNTTIMPNEGIFSNKRISVPEVAKIIMRHGGVLYTVSAIGHQGSADAFNAVIADLNCEVNRIPATMRKGDEAIALKVLGRIPEGQILTREELEKVGYNFFHIICTA